MGSSRHGPVIKYILLGIVLGVALLAFAAIGMRYTDQRPFCTSCHVMQDAGITHKMSTHANLACNDCHAPHNLMSKIPFKAKEGLRDFMANISGNDVPIDLMPDTKDTVNENCKSCHAMTNLNVASMESKPYCIDCHRNVAHKSNKPISTRKTADE